MTWAQFATDFGDFLCVTAVVLVIVLWNWRAFGRTMAGAVALSYALAVAAVAGGKSISSQLFVDVTLTTMTHFSRGAPSGHAVLSMVVYGTAAYFCSQGRSALVRVAGLLGGLVIVTAVDITRVLLITHTIPDVMSGVAVGAAILALPIWVHRKLGAPEPRLSPGWLLAGIATACAALILSGVRIENDLGLL